MPHSAGLSKASPENPTPSGPSFKETYIRKGDPLLRTLIQKYCAQHLHRDLLRQIRILRIHPDQYEEDLIEKTLQDFEKLFQELTPPAFTSNQTFVSRWASEPYQKNQKVYPGQKLYKTLKGDLVRSKLEMIIADILFDLNIPYRYEAAVVLLNGELRHPDFTIMNPYTRKIFYLEVCGKMNDAGYVADCVKKISQYAEIDIIQGDNLLLVFEDESTPFDQDAFRKILYSSVLKKRI